MYSDLFYLLAEQQDQRRGKLIHKEIPFYDQPLKTGGRPRLVLSSPSLLPHARPG